MDQPVHALKISLSKNQLMVSCECRARVGTHSKAGKITFDPIGPTKNHDESRELYNNPDNHWAPFGEEDKLGGKKQR